ncbi:Hypothetical predicted protein [Olea europaea subsp. europaea]|uniref:Uncharacterized protein n=1 Tax=Olea europaea subsp. europaea TaxID=158383 RepID=A0A8S0PM39_OLEEU|nr:Hypothetical predicted protein [Olea europaea subsp. europaea]
MQFWAVSGTRCASHVQDAARMLPDFQVFLGSLWNTVCRQCSGRVWAVAGIQPSFRAFLDSFWDTGCNLIFRQIWEVLRHGVQGTSGKRLGRGIFRQLLEPGVQAVSETRLGCGRDAAWFPGIFRQFLGHGNFWDALGLLYESSDFQAFLGSFLDTVFKLCPGYDRDVTLFSGISRQFQGHGVQAMTRTHQGYVGMQPDFQAFLGSSWTWCAGRVWDASWPLVLAMSGRLVAKVGTEPNFKAIMGSFMDTAMFGMRLVHDKDATWFLGSFRDTMCRPCPGYCKDTS